MRKAQRLLVQLLGLLGKHTAVYLSCGFERVEELCLLLTIQPQEAGNLLGGQQEPGQLLHFL